MREVTLHTRLTETDESLPGSRAWVAEVLELSTIAVTTTKSGAPAVFLRKQHHKSKCLAIFHAPFGCGTPRAESWPFLEDIATSEDVDWQELFGASLTQPGVALLRDFSRKCRVLLRSRLRRQDRVRPERLTVHLKGGD